MFQGESRDEILTLNASALGEHQAYARIMELDHDQLVEVLKDEE